MGRLCQTPETNAGLDGIDDLLRRATRHERSSRW